MPVSRPRPYAAPFRPVRSAMVSHILARRCSGSPPAGGQPRGLILAGTHGDENSSIVTLSLCAAYPEAGITPPSRRAGGESRWLSTGATGQRPRRRSEPQLPRSKLERRGNGVSLE